MVKVAQNLHAVFLVTQPIDLVDYFDKYESFCFDLDDDSILQGELNFIYK